MDGGGCGFYSMLFYEAGLICDFLRCLPAAGIGFRVSKSHFPRRETASRFQKVISRGGKRFLDFKKSFPVAGNGFRISKSHFSPRETVFGLQKVISRGGKWDWQLDGFPRREGGHLKDSLACVWVIKNSAAKGPGGVSTRVLKELELAAVPDGVGEVVHPVAENEHARPGGELTVEHEVEVAEEEEVRFGVRL